MVKGITIVQHVPIIKSLSIGFPREKDWWLNKMLDTMCLYLVGVNTMTKKSRRYYTHEGNEIVETAQFFVLINDPCSTTSSISIYFLLQLGWLEKSFVLHLLFRVQNIQRRVYEAMFAYTYNLCFLLPSLTIKVVGTVGVGQT